MSWSTLIHVTRSLSFRATLIAILMAVVSGEASAHGIRLFATAQGLTLEGTLLYADGTPAVGAPVQAFAPDGVVIAQGETNSEGRFSMPARFRCRHRLVGDAGQGHRGLYTINADELPANLPEYTAGAAQAIVDPVATPADPPTGAHELPEEIDTRIDALARQVGLLREQLSSYETAVRFRDVLGGIGYLFGVTGLFALLKARKRRSEP